MTKTPYEIRLDVLGLAQRMLEQNQIQKSNIYNASGHGLPFIKMEDLTTKLSITSADILVEAEKLYSFIEGKDATSRSVGYVTNVTNTVNTGQAIHRPKTPPPPTKK